MERITLNCYGHARIRSDHPLRGFSLIELLVTIGVIVILMVLAIPAFNSMKRSMDLRTGGGVLHEELSQAGQAARTLNCPVEVRLFLAPDPTKSDVRDAVQLFARTESGEDMEAITKRRLLPNGVAVLRDPGQYSSVLGIADGPAADPYAPFYSFRFLPNGTVELVASEYPTLTVVSRTDLESDGLPANFAVVQINPQTAQVRTFQP